MGEGGKETGSGPVSGAGRMTRRNFLKVSGAGLAGAALFGVAGCGGGQEQGGQGPVSRPSGNRLIVGYDQEPGVLNRFLASGTALSTTSTTAGILEPVLNITPDLGYAPLLCDGPPRLVSEDPQIVEYTFKEGLVFSDGEPVTSADARYTYEQVINPDNEIAQRTGWEDIESFETPDDRTVRMVFGTPYAPWRDLLGPNYPILPRHVYEGEDFNTALNNEVVGSGPFKLKEWKKGQSLTIERNDNYWGERAPLNEVTYQFIPDSNTLIASLESGETQFIYPPPDIGLLERLRGINGAKALFKAGVVWEHIAFNLEEVDNQALRQAIAYGINRQQVVDELLQGIVNPLQSWVMPEQTPYYTPAWERYAYDRDRARELADQARSEGANMTVRFSTTADNRLRETLQEVVQQQLEGVGITIEIENTDADTFFAEWTVDGNFQMAEWAWLNTPDPSQTILFSQDQIPSGDNVSGQNYYRYENAEVTRLLKESDRTLDEGPRAELIKQVQEIMAEELPILPMYQRPEYYGFAESLQGPEVNPSLASPFWNVGTWRFS